MKERRTEGGLDRKNLKLQCSSKKVLARPVRNPQTKVAVLGVSHLVGINTPMCSVIGWEHPAGSGLGMNVVVDAEGEHLGSSISYVSAIEILIYAFL